MPGSFELQLAKFAEKAGARADEAVGGVVVALHGKVDERSPVDTGRFRGNWQLGIGSLPGGVLERLDPDGGTVRAEVRAAVPEQASGLVYYIANNLPYTQMLENGWSKQAPSGIVGLTVVEFQSLVDQAVVKAQAAHP